MVVVVLCRLLHLNVDAQTCSMHAQVCPVLLIMLPNGRTAGRGESETSQCSHAVAVRRRRTKACQSLFCCVFFFHVSYLCGTGCFLIYMQKAWGGRAGSPS